jgi:hypothetical protein
VCPAIDHARMLDMVDCAQEAVACLGMTASTCMQVAALVVNPWSYHKLARLVAAIDVQMPARLDMDYGACYAKHMMHHRNCTTRKPTARNRLHQHVHASGALIMRRAPRCIRDSPIGHANRPGYWRRPGDAPPERACMRTPCCRINEYVLTQCCSRRHKQHVQALCSHRPALQ